MDLEKICLSSCELIKKVGNYIKVESNIWKEKGDANEKSKNSLVTYVDTEAEKMLVAELRQLLPEAGFITEENTLESETKVFNWIVDPLDGTTNFIHGVPIYSISVALMKDNNVIMGVVYEVNHGECFYAWQNGNSYLNGKVIQVSQNKTLEGSLLATGFPYYDYTNLDQYLEILKELLHNTRGVRRLGSAAVDLAYVACGRFEGFYEYTLNSWDVAAGSLIVQQAGGRVTDFSGEDNYIFGQEILAACPSVFPDILKVIQQKMSS